QRCAWRVDDVCAHEWACIFLVCVAVRWEKGDVPTCVCVWGNGWQLLRCTRGCGTVKQKMLSAVCCGCGCGCLWRQDAARCDMRVDEVLRARASKALHGLLVLSQKSMMLKQVASRWRSDGKAHVCVYICCDL
ncbi:hypothetical protein PTSG_13226, partial [Salpingoeca rosetta]